MFVQFQTKQELEREVGCVVPVVEVESAELVASGPSVQLGLCVGSLSSVLGVKDLKGGREAVDGLNKPPFLSP